MPTNYARDVDIGRETAEDTVSTVLTRVETLLTDGIATVIESPSGENLDTLISTVEKTLDELRNIRLLDERILGTEVSEIL